MRTNWVRRKLLAFTMSLSERELRHSSLGRETRKMKRGGGSLLSSLFPVFSVQELNEVEEEEECSHLDL